MHLLEEKSVGYQCFRATTSDIHIIYNPIILIILSKHYEKLSLKYIIPVKLLSSVLKNRQNPDTALDTTIPSRSHCSVSL